MTVFQAYLLGLNSILVISVLIIAIYFIRSYNILVRLGVTNTPTPVRDYRASPVRDRVELNIKFSEVNQMRDSWIRAGYVVTSSKRHGDAMSLVMTKKANGA